MTRKNNGQIEPEKKDSQLDEKKDTTEATAEVEKKAEKKLEQKAKPTASSSDDAKTATKVDKTEAMPAELNNKQGKSGAKLATLAIVLTAIFSGGATFMFQQQKSQHQAEIAELQAQIKNMGSQLEQRLSATEASAAAKANSAYHKAETAIKQQSESIKSLQVALADVQGRRPNDWLLAESDYLVKLAGRKLFLEQDVVSATHLMESADQRISVLNDPSLVPLRKEMAKDITALKSVPLIDKDGLALRLISLQQLVDDLPLANAILPDAPTVVEKTVSSDINDWKENLTTSLKDFSEQFITFRVREGNVVPLLSPQQHYYLKENVKGKIETAIRAVYSENQEIYQSSLETANTWAMQFFKLDDPKVKQFEASIKQLVEQNVTVKYPVKLVSQKALSDVINDRLRRQVTSMTSGGEQ